MRLFTSVLASAAMLFVASTASAVVSFNIVNNPSAGPYAVGDLITIDLRTSNPGAPVTFIAGVGAAVMGYSSVVQFVEGSVADTTLFCTNTACSNGLVSIFDSTTPLAQQTSPTVGNYVQIVNAIATTARNGSGARDPGFDGVLNGGDAMFRVVFRAAAPGTTTFDIGTTTDPGLGNVIVSSTAATGGVISVGQGDRKSVV